MPATEDAAYARELREEARREMDICNACRYCEGFCAVFPAMELHREFADRDLNYLANLCHNCRGCYYACQYAPPHEFGINLPQTFSDLRSVTYADHAWPRPFAKLFQNNGTIVSLGLALALALVLGLSGAAGVLGGVHTGPGAFYAVIPWSVMVVVGGASFLFALLALCIGGVRFWRDVGSGPVLRPRPWAQAVGDVLSLRNLGGGGHGCNDRGEAFSTTRRWLHHALFYGFLACFAATSVATLYDHFLNWPAPYPWYSLPVALGTLGGIGLLVGTGGMAWLKVTGDAAPSSAKLLGSEFALLLLLGLAAFSGLLLLVLRATAAMGTLLALHLGVILALFLLLPYSRMVHGLYRSLALLRHAQESAAGAKPVL